MPKSTERSYELLDYVWVKQGEKGEHLARRKRRVAVAAASAVGASTGTSVGHDDSAEQKQPLKEETYVYAIVSGWDDHTQAMVDCYEVQWSTSNMWDVVPVRNCRPMMDTNATTNAAGTDASTDDAVAATITPSDKPAVAARPPHELRRSRRATITTTTTPNKLRSDDKEQQQHKKQRTKCSEIELDDVVISPRLFHTTKMSHRKKPAALKGRLSQQFSLADALQKRNVVAHPIETNQNATLVTPTQPSSVSDGHGVAVVAATNRATLHFDDATTAVDGTVDTAATTAATATTADKPKAAKGPPPPSRVRPSHCRAICFTRAPDKSHSGHNAKGYKKQKSSSACSEIVLDDVVMSPHFKKREPRKPNGPLSPHLSLADALQRKVVDKAAQQRDGNVVAKDDDAPTKRAALVPPQHMPPLENGQGQGVDSTAAAAANRTVAASAAAATTAKELHGLSTPISATAATQSTKAAATKVHEKAADATILLNDRIHLGDDDSNGADVSETTAAATIAATAARHARKRDKPVVAANGQSKSSGKRKRASSLDIDDDRKMTVDCPFCLTGTSTTSSTKGHVHRQTAAGIAGESHFYRRYRHLSDSVQLTPLRYPLQNESHQQGQSKKKPQPQQPHFSVYVTERQCLSLFDASQGAILVPFCREHAILPAE